jgi:CelD/BcsL family acetyltransferase involved in cellulose biosynthesis
MESKHHSVVSQFLQPHDKRWLDFLESRPEATTFHHPSWLAVLAESYGYRPSVVAVCDGGNRVVAGLPLMEVRSPLTGRRWVSLPFTDYCQPLAVDPDAINALTRDLALLYESGTTPKIEIRWQLPECGAVQPHTDYYLHSVKLGADPQAVMKRFERTHRQNIGTAENRGVRIERGTEPEHLRCFYEMQVETRRRKGLPVQPRKFFDLIQKHILAQGLGFILLAYKDQQCLAGGLFLHWHHTLTYKYAASCGEDQQFRPNNLLSWTAMRWGCENGYTVFDLGRTELENAGLRRFKKGWGADEVPLVYSVLSHAQPHSGESRLSSLMEPIIQKSPSWVSKAAGELLYRHVG